MLAWIAITAAIAASAAPLHASDIAARVNAEGRAFSSRAAKALSILTTTRRPAPIRFPAPAPTDRHAHEANYREVLCEGMDWEVSLPNGARADCISDTHAIEVDFSEKWAEALGQALLYAAATGLQPGIFLVCRGEDHNCLGHRLRLDEAIQAWNLPVEVWPVEEQDVALGD